MLTRVSFILMIVLTVFVADSAVFAQSADNKTTIISKPGEGDDEDHPKNFKETLVKMRIEKEKKEFEEMIGRGEEALKLSEELEKAYTINGKLNPNELNKLATVEKLVKKIRNELGGDDDESDDDKNEASRLQITPIAQGDAIKSFKSTTLKLFE